MTILAKAVDGHEYFYKPHTAHHVSKASAEQICDILTKQRYKLKDGEVWFVYDVDSCDDAHYYAQEQSFYKYRGKLMERSRA